MNRFFFKLFLLITVLILSNVDLFAQYTWTKYPGNPLNVHGTPGSWDQSVGVPCVIFNSDLNRYEMWYTSGGNNGIGFAWSTDGIIWTKHPTAVLTPSPSSWDYPFVGVACVLKEVGTYKMWYTGGQTGNLTSSHIGYATSPDGISWTKYSGNPVLSPGTGWESGAVGYPSVIKISDTYYMFYSGAVTVGIARTGRAISSDGITWQKDTVHNPVLPAGGTGQWDRNNYLGKVIDLNNTLYIYYTGETNPGVSGTAIGGAVSTDMGITWTKFENNPILPQGTSGQWDYGWIEGGCPVFANNELRLYYDGGGAATGWLGRIGFAISDPLPAGTYTVGTGGNFATIEEAFDKLETDGVAGNVTIELIDELYTATTTQYGFLLNGPIPGAGPNSRVTIKPAENKNVIVEGNGEGIFHFNNTSYLILDGVGISGATTLTVHNLVTTPVSYNDAITFVGNCDHNVVQNTIALIEDITRVNSGIVFWPETNVIGTPDSNLIQNNFIKKATYGFYIGANTFQTSKASGNIIKGNMIGSETDSLITWGIQAERVQNTIIEDNIVQNITRQAVVGTNDFCYGINVYAGNETIIGNNVIYDINSSSGVGATGILLSGAGSMNNLVYNNMVYDIQSSSLNFDSRVSGIQLFEQNNPKIYYNSVYLSGQGDGANPLGSAALFVYGGFGNSLNVDSKNNIFVNTRDEGQYCASAIYNYSASNLTSDYNDLFYDDTNNNNCLVRISSTNYHTLADWQATGKDSNSITEMPNFIDPFLHIDTTIVTMLNAHAIPIAGIETDIDGQGRNILTPDIGADEFDIVSGVEDEEIFPTEFALEQNYPNPFNPNTVISYQLPANGDVTLKVFDILGNEVATLVDEYKQAGKYEVEFNIYSDGSRNLSSGIYFYKLQAGNYIQTRKMVLLK